MRLPFKTRRQLKAEIEHLTEQLRIETEARRKDAAAYRGEIHSLDDVIDLLSEKASTLEERLGELLEAEQTINRLTKELNEQKDIARGVISERNELKQRNAELAQKLRKMEEKCKTYDPKRPKK